MTWTAVDRPAVRPEVQATDVDGELVLWDPIAERVHRLDPIASLLWPFLDGSAAIGELAVDLTDVWQVSEAEATRSLVELVEQLAAAELIGPSRTVDDPGETSRAVANPVRCGTNLSGWAWSDPIGLDVAGRTMTVRTTDPDLTDAIGEALAAHRAAPADPVTYSLVVADGPGDLHLLYWGHCLVARCGSRREAIAHLLAHLAGHAEPPPGVVRLDGHVLCHEGRGVVVFATDRSRLWRLAARLRSAGAWVVPGAWVDVDVHDGALAAAPAPLTCDTSILTRWVGEPVTLPASLRSVVKLAQIVLPGPLAPLSGSELVGTMSEHRLIADPAHDLPLVPALLRNVPTSSVPPTAFGQLVEQVASALGLRAS